MAQYVIAILIHDKEQDDSVARPIFESVENKRYSRDGIVSCTIISSSLRIVFVFLFF